MRRRTFTLRAIALLGAGSAAIHQLRYAIGYGAEASHALAHHPHGYMSLAMPGVLTTLLIAIGGVLLRAASGRRGTGTLEPRSLTALWVACALAFATIYCTQETLEGAGAFAGSGWIGVALALPFGLLVALALRGADAAESMPLRDPLSRITIAVVSRTGIREAAAHAQTGPTPFGARGPPVSFVV